MAESLSDKEGNKEGCPNEWAAVFYRIDSSAQSQYTFRAGYSVVFRLSNRFLVLLKVVFREMVQIIIVVFIEN